MAVTNNPHPRWRQQMERCVLHLTTRGIGKVCKEALAYIAELEKDRDRLDFLSLSNEITTQDASDIVNGYKFRGVYVGTIRKAIDLAIAAQEQNNG